MSDQTRRTFLAAAGGIGLAGCSSAFGNPGSDGTEPNGTTETTQPQPTSTRTATPAGKLGNLPGEQFEDFEDLERWFPIGDNGTVEPSTADPYVGTQSASVTAEDGRPYGSLFKAFEEPVDFTGKNLSLAVKVSEPEISKVAIDLLAPDRGNKVRMMRTLSGPTDRWLLMDFGVPSGARQPDLSAVHEIRITCRHRGGVREPVEFAVDDLRLVDQPERGAVLLTFDDSHRSHYEEAFSRMREYGMPGVEGVIAETVYRQGRLDVGQLREMSSAGWDVASHPFTSGRRLSEFAPEEQERRITENKQFLDRKGFRDGARHLTVPQNFRGPETYELIAEHHDTMFTFGGMPNALPSTTTLNYGRINAPSADTVRRFVDYAEEFGQLVVVNHHVLGGDEGLSLDVFEDELEYVDAADVDVVTATDLLERYGASAD
jgi:peptidoglycan/xylan/chitin deacetylase (PgdA/CDA1 family)